MNFNKVNYDLVNEPSGTKISNPTQYRVRIIAVVFLTWIITLASLFSNNNAPALDEDADELDKLFMHDVADVTNIAEESEKVIYSVKAPFQNYLPRTVIPQSYRIRLQVFMDESEYPEKQFTADGFVSILVKCEEPTNEIVLHADLNKAMKIQKTAVRLVNNGINNSEGKIKSTKKTRSIDTKDNFFDPDQDFYTIPVHDMLEKDALYRIEIQYTTTVFRTQLEGLYLSNYTDPNTNELKYLAVTQLEATAARQVFPCFDEPALKADFTITLGHSAKYNSISNTVIKQTNDISGYPGWKWDVFEKSPKMSTYLVAILISEYSCESAPTDVFPGKSVQVCGPSHRVKDGEGVYAAEKSAQILKYFGELLDIEYPMPKMISAAIPHFQAGAMENYGACFYRDYALLYEGREKTSESLRNRIDSIVAHEFAHQWFGNLVTCKTWNQIWLNEGFASYFSYYGEEAVSPEFEGFKTLYYKAMRTAFHADSFLSSLPVVNHSESSARFSSISYSKGASLIRMMEHFLSKSTLLKGLSEYLKIKEYDSADQQDLFIILDAQAKKDSTATPHASVLEIMQSWTLKPGYPLIKVTQVGPNELKFTQERFLRSHTTLDDKTYVATEYWHCPIFLQTNLPSHVEKSKKETFQKPALWLTNEQASSKLTLKLEENESPSYIVVNPDAAAFARVIYDETLQAKILRQLQTDHTDFSVVTRAQFIEDYFASALSKYTSVTSALDMTKYLHRETEPIVWQTFFSYAHRLYRMLSAHSGVNFTLFKNYLNPKLSQLLQYLKIDQTMDDIGVKVIFKGSVLQWAALLDNPMGRQIAQSLVHNWMAKNNVENMFLSGVPVDLRYSISCIAVSSDASGVTKFLYDKYLSETDLKERKRILSSLGCSADKNFLQEMLHSFIENTAESNERLATDGATFFKEMGENLIGREMLIPFLNTNYQKLLQSQDGAFAIKSALWKASSYWNTEEDIVKVNEFVTKTGYDDLIHYFESRLKPMMDRNKRWVVGYGSQVISWLQSNV